MGRGHESVATETRSGENCANGQHQAAGRSNGAGSARSTGWSAGDLGVVRGGCRGPVRELSQSADPDHRALPRRRSERHRGAPDRPDHEPRLGTAGGDRQPRPGANTIIGAQAAAKAAADGYTLFMAIDSTLVMNQFVYKSLPYAPLDDFVPITLTAKTISVLAASAASGPKSVKELMARAKTQPGKLNYGAGTITAQLMGHLFHKAAGLDIVYVPFKGTPETVNGLLTGSVEL